MAGILYGIGVGPGDPELLTLKAVRLIRETEWIALPGRIPQETLAYRIAVQAVPEIADKKLIAIDCPMTKDREILEESHRTGAKQLETCLQKGENAAFLAEGDITIYSTFSYLQRLVREDGYPVQMVNGIPSFCTAAAALGIPLAEGSKPLHIVPTDRIGDRTGTYVLMKSGRKLEEIKQQLRAGDYAFHTVCMVENCSLPDEKIYSSLEEIPKQGAYFSLLVAQ